MYRFSLNVYDGQSFKMTTVLKNDKMNCSFLQHKLVNLQYGPLSESISFTSSLMLLVINCFYLIYAKFITVRKIIGF